LQETVVRNAEDDLQRHRLRRAADHNARSRALTELQSALGLRQAPLRIECYDMSHLQGTDYVGSMVVFEDGLAKKSDYRKFAVRSVPGNDDYAAMEEVLTRRLGALVAERAERARRVHADVAPEDASGAVGVAGADGVPGPGSDPAPKPTRRRFAYTPQLLLIDGGIGQLRVAERVLDRLGLAGDIEVASLAKQFEEVYRPGSSDPVRVPRGSEALYLLQRVRDEAHRFAVTFHRQQRGARMTGSVLDGVAGLGPTRRRRLHAELGGVRALRAVSLDDLHALSWLPDAVGDAVFARLHPTGERVSTVTRARAAVGETLGT
jgi:excinuclease ABC subunit C